jgi:translation initiation factor 2B subunit (eIF-2B alpha/beta/delta family)
MNTKICCTCKIEKLFSDFNKNKSTKDGLHKQCKSCLKEYRKNNESTIKEKIKERAAHTSEKRKEYLKEYLEKNKEVLKEKKKLYREKNKKQLQEKVSSRYNKIKNENPEIILLYNARARAKKYGIPFSITVEDIVIPEICPILKISLTVSKSKVSPNSPTIDKIVPELGYVKGNIQVISHRANMMKSDASIEELKLFSKWIENEMHKIISDVE